jgi:hypothetical protein
MEGADGYSRMFVVNLCKKVRDMRDLQKAYFRNPHKRHLMNAKEKEKEVDEMIEEIINPKNQLDLPL